MRIFKLTGLAFLATALAPMGVAMAQGEAAEPEEELEEIITTGSRIARKDLTGAAAVTVLDEEAIRVTGNVSIGDVLQDLTVNANGINTQFNNGGNGATRVNLRGIGAARTLTLLNGRRMVGTAGSSSVDLNAIPLAAIERVEVLKDGASAVYGSDAVAGVVNIITRTDFEGVDLNLYTGQSAEGDGEIIDVNLTFGMAGDRGNVIVSAGFYEQQDIFHGDRDWAFYDLDYDWTTGDVSTLGSSAPPQGNILGIWSADPGNAAWQALTGAGGACPSAICYNDPTVGWRDLNTAGTSDSGEGDLYNYQPINYLLTPQKRYNVYMAGRYELSDSVSAFMEGHYLNRQSDQLLAPTPLFTISEGIAVSAANEFNPFGRDFIDVRRRFLEAGGRNFLQDVDTFRTVAGLQGDLPNDWSWEASFNYGRTKNTDTGRGRFIRSRVINAIGPSQNGVCYTSYDAVTDTYSGAIAGCSPLNLFGGYANAPISQEAINYISYEGIDFGYQTQRTYSLNFSGDLFEMPAGAVGMAIGAEYREERGGDIPDPITNGGDTTGNKREITRGSYDVTEAYLEFLVPITEGFEASLAVRHSDYSGFGTTTNGKVGLIWNVNDQFTLRGTLSEAFRAPSINALFGGSSDSFPAATDPCDTDPQNGGPRSANEDTNCTADGLPAAYVDARTQLKSRVGGNPLAGPETADTFTAGLVWQPGFAEGFAMTLDWWDVELDDAITSLGVNVILAGCYDVAPAERRFCDRIVREPGTGFLSLIDDRTGNAGGLVASGMDTTFSYDMDSDVGDWRFHLDITYLNEFTRIEIDDTETVGLGYYDLGVYAEWKYNFNVNWRRDDWMVNYNMRFIDGFTECEDDNCQALENSDPSDDPLLRSVDNYFQHDLQIAYGLDFDSMGQGQITFGIQNLLDEEPPRVYNGFISGTDTANYDYLGRYFYLSYNHQM